MTMGVGSDVFAASYDAVNLRELNLARGHLQQLSIVLHLANGMGDGAAVGKPGSVDTSGIATEDLELALRNAAGWPFEERSAGLDWVTARAQLVLRVRKAWRQGDFETMRGVLAPLFQGTSTMRSMPQDMLGQQSAAAICADAIGDAPPPHATTSSGMDACEPAAAGAFTFGEAELRTAWLEAGLQLSLAGLQRGLTQGFATSTGGDMDLAAIDVDVIDAALTQLGTLPPSVVQALDHVDTVVPSVRAEAGAEESKSSTPDAEAHTSAGVSDAGAGHSSSARTARHQDAGALIQAATLVRDLRVALKGLKWHAVKQVLAQAAALGLTRPGSMCADELAAARRELAYRIIVVSLQAAASQEGDVVDDPTSCAALDVVLTRATAVRYERIPSVVPVVDLVRWGCCCVWWVCRMCCMCGVSGVWSCSRIRLWRLGQVLAELEGCCHQWRLEWCAHHHAG